MSQCCNVGLWTSLIKQDMALSLPNNIRLGTDISPVDFRTLPKLVLADFRLRPVEVDEFIRLSSVRMGAEKAGRLLVDPAVCNVISTNCNGLLGALSVSAKEIVKCFHYDTSVTGEKIVSFCLPRAMFSYFKRCYSSGMGFLPEKMQACLARCLTVGPLSAPKF